MGNIPSIGLFSKAGFGPTSNDWRVTKIIVEAANIDASAPTPITQPFFLPGDLLIVKINKRGRPIWKTVRAKEIADAMMLEFNPPLLLEGSFNDGVTLTVGSVGTGSANGVGGGSTNVLTVLGLVYGYTEAPAF